MYGEKAQSCFEKKKKIMFSQPLFIQEFENLEVLY